jgi:competence protein ComEA
MNTWKTMAMVAAVAGLFAAHPAEAAKKVVSGVVNLNTASPAELERLPGVGKKAAAQIVAHRQKTPFARVEELVKVKGFGKKKLEALRPHLAVEGQTTLRVEGPAKKAKRTKGQARSGPPVAPRK